MLPYPKIRRLEPPVPKRRLGLVRRIRGLPLALCLCAVSAGAADSGPMNLRVSPGSLRVDSQAWSARFGFDVRPPADGTPLRRPGWQLLGDYYFSRIGGLRATSGLLGQAGPRPNADAATTAPNSRRGMVQGLGGDPTASPLWHAAADTSTATYVGLGYSKGQAGTGWELSADLGLLALREADGVRLGRSTATSADWPRELRLRPMLQLGVSYSF